MMQLFQGEETGNTFTADADKARSSSRQKIQLPISMITYMMKKTLGEVLREFHKSVLCKRI